MEWAAILQIIMAIISAIMEFLGGGGFTAKLKADQVFTAAHLQFECRANEWTQTPEVKNGVFRGTIQSKCTIEGQNGGGFAALRRHLVDQIYRGSQQVLSGPVVQSYHGIPSNLFDVNLEIEKDSDSHMLRGTTEVATDGFTELHHVFTATHIPTSGNLKYLKALEDLATVKVTDRTGFYEVTLAYKTEIAKPALLSSSTFKDSVVKNQQEKMEARKLRTLNDFANNL